MENFPPKFEERVKNDPFLGKELLEALNTVSPISVRINALKKHPQWPNAEQVTWCPTAYYLHERPLFTLDPLFHAGTYYPQEAGSMILDFVIRQLDLDQEVNVLDLCAAPGGKSTLLASFMNNKGLLVSNEVIQQRARILRENMNKWGTSNVVVTNNDPKDFSRLPSFFGLIVIDAPCSGEGMFRKNPTTREEWSEENVLLCASRQKRILMDTWDSLKPGGFLFYSTCTFNEMENENNVSWLMEQTDASLVKLQLPNELPKGRNDIGNYFIPGKVQAEGFYFAVLQKLSGADQKIKYQRNTIFKKQKDLLDLEKYANIEGHELINWNERLLALPSSNMDEMLHVQTKLTLLKMGTTIGEIGRKGIIPSEELALSTNLLMAENVIDLKHEQALQYLHGDTFSLDGNLGFNLMTFDSVPLGWIKNVGNRFNNLYPKEWRIRMNIS